MRIIGCGLCLSILAAASPSGAEPDFFLMMDKCKIVVGYLVLSDDSLKVIDGESGNYACER